MCRWRGEPRDTVFNWSYGVSGALAVAVSAGCGLHREAPSPVASLRMTCVPESDGVRCRVIALSRDVSQAARDVTSKVSWRLSGSGTGRMSPPGVIHTVLEGNLDVTAQYEWASAHGAVRLALGRPGQLLGAIHGTVFAEDETPLHPMPGVNVVIVSGDSAGTQTSTRADGTYDLVWIVPGEVVLRATKTGYEPTEATAVLLPGDTAVNLVLQPARAPAASEARTRTPARWGRALIMSSGETQRRRARGLDS
jgi:hypothetical protein